MTIGTYTPFTLLDFLGVLVDGSSCPFVGMYNRCLHTIVVIVMELQLLFDI